MPRKATARSLDSVEAGIERITLGAARAGRGTGGGQKLRSILVALDGSPHGGTALTWALGIAKATGARIAAVSVGPPAAWVDEYGARVSEWSAAHSLFEEFAEDAKEVLADAVAAGKRASVVVRPIAVAGSPSALISKVARQVKADLIVLGSHGHGGLDRLAGLGSVAEVVKHGAPCSVLIARGSYPPRAAVLATDGSAPSKKAVRTGLAVADAIGARSMVVHVFDLMYGYAKAPKGATEQQVRALIETDTRSTNFKQGPYEFAPRVGSAPVTIMNVAQANGAGLIVVGSRGRGALKSALLGSVSDKVTRNAPVSVLVVK